MAIQELYVDTGTTIGTTEWSLTNDAAYSGATPITTEAMVQALILFSSMVAGDQFEVKLYEKVYSAASQSVLYSAVVSGPQARPLVTPAIILKHGWDFTVTKLAGTDRSVAWSIRAGT